MFEERTIPILGYNLETMFSEKLETIISRGTANTRMRDFYDIYLLTMSRGSLINKDLMIKALQKTANKRGTEYLLEDKDRIVTEITNSDALSILWTRYQKTYKYAESVPWEDVLSAIKSSLT